MARRRRRSRSTPRNAYANVPSLPRRVLRRPVRVALPAIEDRRRYHPLRSQRPTMRTDGRRTERLVLDAKHRPRLMHRLAFPDPQRVVTCVRRKERREVLFATGGASKRNKKRRRRTWRSNIRC